MIRIRNVARGYWFELLIAFLAIAGMLELIVGRDSPGAPPMTLWVAVPAVAVLALPLFARRRFPFAAPAAYWILAAAISFGCLRFGGRVRWPLSACGGVGAYRFRPVDRMGPSMPRMPHVRGGSMWVISEVTDRLAAPICRVVKQRVPTASGLDGSG